LPSNESIADVVAVTAAAVIDYDDIDLPHQNDTKYPTEYIEEIFENSRQAELDYRPSPTDYMTTFQDDINERMRSILVDWLVEVADEYNLKPSTLHLSISTIDRVLCKRRVSRGNLQLVGCACMLLAGKYEEIYPPSVEDYAYISDNTYTAPQVLEEEKCVLNDIEYVLTVPTAHTFLTRFLQAAHATTEQEYLAQYFAEIILVHMEFLEFKPSVCAATAVYYMRFVLDDMDGSARWTRTLQHYTKLSELDLQPCCRILHAKHSIAGDDDLKAVYEKYNADTFDGVAEIPPPDELPF